MVEMFGIDIGHHCNIGGQLEESAVGFVGLHHHPVALAHAGIGAIGVDDAAIDHRWVHAARIKQRADHGCRRRLSMRAANGDGVAEAHEFGQHLRPANQWNGTLARLDALGIVFRNR